MNIWRIIAVVLGAMTAVLVVDSIILIFTIMSVTDKLYGIFLIVGCLGIARILIGIIRAFYHNGFLEIKHN